MAKKNLTITGPNHNFSLTSLSELIQEVYIRSKHVMLSLFIISIANFITILVSIILLGIIGFCGLIFTHNMSFFIVLLSIEIFLEIIFLVVINLITQAAIIFIIKSNGNIPVQVSVKKSFPFLIALFLTQLWGGIIILGGYFLLLLPGILLSIFFIFAPYEVLLQNQTPINALKKSYVIVKNHFGEIFIRVLILIIFQLLIQSFPRFLPQGNMILHSLITIFSIILSILFGWFSATYYLFLYQDALKLTTPDKNTRLFWIYLVSCIGWILGIALIIGLISLLIILNNSGQLQKLIHQYQRQNIPSYQIHSPQRILPDRSV